MAHLITGRKKRARKPLFPGLRMRIRQIGSLAIRYKYQILAALAILLLAIFILAYFRKLVIMLVLMLLASVSMIYNRWVNLSIGVELIILATVIAGIFYGAGIGVLVGIITLLSAEIIGGRADPRTVVSFIGIIVVGAVAHSFAPSQIRVAGITLTVLYDLIIIPGYIYVGSNPVKSVIFAITHIAWNVLIFLNVAPLIVQLML